MDYSREIYEATHTAPFYRQDDDVEDPGDSEPAIDFTDMTTVSNLLGWCWPEEGGEK